MSKMTITDLNNLKGKVVFVRVDFNVPLKNGEISDDNRITYYQLFKESRSKSCVVFTLRKSWS